MTRRMPLLAGGMGLLFGGMAYGQTAELEPPEQLPAEQPDEIVQLLANARMWAQKNRGDLERQLLNKALLLDPVDPEVREALAELELRSNEPEKAEAHLLFLQREHPKHPATARLQDSYRLATRDKKAMAMVRLLARTGKTQEAWIRLQALFPRGVPKGELGLEYYRILASTGTGMQRARRGLERWARAEPKNMSVRLTLADVYIDSPDHRLKGVQLAQALAKRPDVDHERALQIWRRGLVALGDEPDSQAVLQAFLKENPDDASLKDQLQRAQQRAEEQRKLEADPAWQAQQRGLAALDKDKLDIAEREFERVLKTRQHDPDLLQGLGVLRMRQGRHAEAKSWFVRGAKQQPDQTDKWQGLIETAGFWGALKEAERARNAGDWTSAVQYASKALAMRPHDVDALTEKASIHLGMKEYAEAERLFRLALSAPPPATDNAEGNTSKPTLNQTALRGVLTVFLAQQRLAEANGLLDNLRQRFAASRQDIDIIEADFLSQEAEKHLAQGETSPAIQLLEQAVKLNPQAAWTRFSLARLYERLQMPELGRDVLEEGVRLADSAELRYAQALFLNGQGEVDQARAALKVFPKAQQTDAARELAQALDMRYHHEQANLLAQAGEDVSAKQHRQQAETLAQQNPDWLAELADRRVGAGEVEQGLTLLLNTIVQTPASPARDELEIRYARLLAQVDRDQQLKPWLAKLADRPLTSEQKKTLQQLQVDLSLREARQAREKGDFRQAHASLDTVQADPTLAVETQDDLKLARAELWLAEGCYPQAQQMIDQVLEQQPKHTDAQLLQARLLQERGKAEQAQQVLANLLPELSPTDLQNRLSVARRLLALSDTQQAESLLKELQQTFPAEPEVVIQQGRVQQQQGAYQTALAHYQQAKEYELAQGITNPVGPTAAENALADLEKRRQPHVATAFQINRKAGDAGASDFSLQETPIYMQFPLGYDGHVFAHADQVVLDGGQLDRADNRKTRDFATIAAFGADRLTGPLRQVYRGTVFALGYQNDHWRVDIGKLPSDFPVASWLGGVRYQNQQGPWSWQAEAFRRPVTSSVLSFAGKTDPITGETWGGVVRQGVAGGVGWRSGDIRLFTDVTAAKLTGKNIPDNRELNIRSGVNWDVIDHPFYTLSTGATLTYWQFEKNLRHYQFGHGGYYSPQRYVSLALPVEWQARGENWSYRIGGSVSYSNNNEKEAPFFPNHATLQQLAAQRASVENFSPPRHSGGKGGGFGYSVRGAIEYRVNDALTIGATAEIDRSKDYEPNRAGIYLRYHFSPQKDKMSYPSLGSARPYSQY